MKNLIFGFSIFVLFGGCTQKEPDPIPCIVGTFSKGAQSHIPYSGTMTFKSGGTGEYFEPHTDYVLRNTFTYTTKQDSLFFTVITCTIQDTGKPAVGVPVSIGMQNMLGATSRTRVPLGVKVICEADGMTLNYYLDDEYYKKNNFLTIGKLKRQ